jgi:hypothetical protein
VTIQEIASPRRPVTDSEVLDQFKVAGGKGPIPDIHGVKDLTHAINHGEFVGIFGSSKDQRELAKNEKFTLSARLRKVFAAARPLVLEDAENSLLLAQVPPP